MPDDIQPTTIDQLVARTCFVRRRGPRGPVEHWNKSVRVIYWPHGRLVEQEYVDPSETRLPRSRVVSLTGSIDDCLSLCRRIGLDPLSPPDVASEPLHARI